MNNKVEKTHWLQSPNKNYLGHWDLPDGKDLILTIESAQWEEVKNPINNKSDSKRVIRFKEKVKPLICNQTNAQSIVVSTGVKFMEDSKGQCIALFVDNIKDKRTKEDVDCIRIRRTIIAHKLDELVSLLEIKKGVLNADMLSRANQIIDNKEVASYDKIIKYLKSC